MISFFILVIGLSLTFVLMTMFISFVRWFSLIGGVLSILIYFLSPDEFKTKINNYSDSLIDKILSINYSELFNILKDFF